jgi:SAM-dependent methyltransferase
MLLDELDPGTAPAAPSPGAVRDEIRRRTPSLYTTPPLEEVYQRQRDLLVLQDVLSLAEPPTLPGRLSRFKAAIKIKLARGLYWLFAQQNEFNEAVAVHASESTRVLATLDTNVVELFASLETLRREVERMAERPGGRDARPARPDAEPCGWGAGGDPLAECDVLTRSECSPGTRDNASSRQRVYLCYLRDAGKVVDLACGRGELVELLEQEGTPAWGVESDPDLAEDCRQRNLPVTRANAAEYLDELPDGSLGGVFLGRAIEQLTAAEISGLLRRCRAKLRPGGVVVAEAINPACPEAVAGLSADPARARLLPPNQLRFSLEAEGFATAQFVVSGPVGPDLPPAARGRAGLPPGCSGYHHYAVVGRA